MPKSTAQPENAAVYEIRIEMKPPIRIAGQAARTSNARQQKEQIVPRLMFDFMATRVRQVTDRVNMQEFFGVLDMSEEPDDSDFFTWVAGVEVSHASKPPAGLIVKEFPAMLYAVITCGGIAPVGLFSYMYREWLPKSDYESAARYAIQYHGPQFKGSLDADSKIEVWFPVRFQTEAAGPLLPEDKANGMSAPLSADERIPAILYDGADIDVLWDGHEDAIGWYQDHLGWKMEQTENWKPDPRASHGKMTHMGNGVWLESVITSERLPYHFAERGTVESAVRWCWKTRDVLNAHTRLRQNGIRTTEIVHGPGGERYFDLWCTAEGARITVHEDPKLLKEGFHDSSIRIGVSDLEAAAEWYRRYVGMDIQAVYPDKGYAILQLGVNHKPGQIRRWILERLSPASFQGNVNGPIRPRCFIPDRDAFFVYHRFLRENGVQTGDFGGFVQKGYVKFHFYDPDGNRFNVCSF